MAYCSREAIDIWNKYCKEKSIKIGDKYISHLPIHEVLKVIDIVLKSKL